MLTRALKRRKEMGVRLAIGAGRMRLLRQLLTENLLLASIGGSLGLLVAVAASRVLAGVERPFHLDLMLETGLDVRLLAYALAISILTAVLFGAAPLRHAFRTDLTTAMRAEDPHVGHRRLGLRDILVAFQVALSMALVVCAVLFVRTLRNAQATDVTYDPGKVLMIRLDLAERKLSEARGRQFYSDLLDRLSWLPGTRSSALVLVTPMGGRRGGNDIIPAPGADRVQVDFNIVTPAYFETVGLPLLRGRVFDRTDREGSTPVAMVNERMARRFWPGQDPIGKEFQIAGTRKLVAIVGVVRDGRFRNYRDRERPGFYLPLAQEYSSQMNLEVRATANLLPLAAAVVREIHVLDKDMPVATVQTLESFRNAGLGQERLTAYLLSGLGALAVVLAVVGLYGVLAFWVAQRTREIGLRMALGAGRSNVLRSVVGRTGDNGDGDRRHRRALAGEAGIRTVVRRAANRSAHVLRRRAPASGFRARRGIDSRATRHAHRSDGGTPL